MRTEQEVGQIINDLSVLKGMILPQNKAETKRFRTTLKEASSVCPLAIYVGSCPDYSHENGLYTHKSLGSGVPLLSQIHLREDKPLLDVLERRGIPFKYTLMIADTEAIDEYFCRKFTNGSEEEFLRRCKDSLDATSQAVKSIKGAVSTSFFREFGRERFVKYQCAYEAVLGDRYQVESSFAQRVRGDINARMSLYHQMYKEVIDGKGYLSSEEGSFLVGRTIRTMAQYLTLGRLIAALSPNVVIMNHPTRNIGVYNDRNKFLLPEDGLQPQPTIPVIQIQQEIY